MKRTLAAALALSLFAPLGLVGCGEKESSVTEEVQVETPEGTTTVQDEETITKEGDNPPPVTATPTDPEAVSPE